MNGIDLLNEMKRGSTARELLNSVSGKTKTETQSKQGNMYEKMWDIIIKLGFSDLFSNETHEHYYGNINTCNVKQVNDVQLYLQKTKVFGKGKGGSSDITLKEKENNHWIFISSKFYLDDNNKNIDDYDVEKIMAVVNQHSHKYKNYAVCLLVHDKTKLASIISSSHATNNYIKHNINDVMDLADLELCFQRFKEYFNNGNNTNNREENQNQTQQSINNDNNNDNDDNNNNGEEFTELFCNTKTPLKLRFHQKLITHKQMVQINKGEKQLLLGAKPRSGKTYCVGGLFAKYKKTNGKMNAMVVTPAPTETISQFTEDLFNKHSDFTDVNVVEINKSSDFENLILQQNNIIIVSKQLLDGFVKERTITAISDLSLNFIAFDENHFHGTTEMAKQIIHSYSVENTVCLFLTATYAKPLNEWNIPENCQFYWDIEDEQLCKSRNIQGLIEKHGEEVTEFITNENMEHELSPYDKMPDLHMITNMMDRERFDEIKEKIKDTSYGFSNSTLLCGNYSNEVDLFLRYITGSDKERDYPKKDMSIFGRIKRISTATNNRTKLNNGDFTTQLWFLPFGIGMKIDVVSEHLKKRMTLNKVLRNYEIKIVNSKKSYKLKDIKQEIHNWELKAKDDEKDGLILLAGNQLTLGITLPFVDVVFLMNDVMSSDKITQMMYRCMTESIHTADNDRINNGTKKMGFVVDLNISRVLTTMLDHNIYKKDLSVEHKIKYLVENNLINIDSDLFENHENKTKLVEKLMNIWKENPTNHLKTLLRKIEENVIDVETGDQNTLNRYFTTSTKNGGNHENVKFDEDGNDELQTGKSIVRIEENNDDNTTHDNDEKSETDDDDTNKITNISLTKDVLPFVIPLICILTMDTQHKDIIEMIEYVENDTLLLEVFDDQSLIWWNKTGIIKLIENMLLKYINKNSFIYNVAIQFKMSLQSLIDRPKELLELIDSCLKPKQKEKQENGEVFTPMHLINEMLDNLDKHYVEEYRHSIFTEPTLKWFDPASGMGNFPVAVYLRLMDGLKQCIPNEKQRKKHIIEKMLFMSELNKKNVFTCRQIFDANGEHNLNLHEGDTLTMDVEKEWGVENKGFDVVLGNPPYNKGGIRSHTGKQLGEKNETIWTKFVEKSFNEWLKPNGFLVFINPLSWLKKSHSLHDVMLEKHIMWLKLWDNIKSLATINGKIPISLFITHNRLNVNKLATKITSEIQSKKLFMTSLEHLNCKQSIPLAFHNIFHKLIKFIETHNCSLEFNTKTVKSYGSQHNLPCEYSSNDMLAVHTYTIKDGLMVKKTSCVHPDANKPKLIISNKASFTGSFIDDGRLSLTGGNNYYILGDKLELLQKMLNFKIINIIGHFTKYGQDFLSKASFEYIPDIRKLGINDIEELEFYTMIGLTTQEINQINGVNDKQKNNEFNENKTELNKIINDKPKKIMIKVMKPKKK